MPAGISHWLTTTSCTRLLVIPNQALQLKVDVPWCTCLTHGRIPRWHRSQTDRPVQFAAYGLRTQVAPILSRRMLISVAAMNLFPKSAHLLAAGRQEGQQHK